MQSNSSCKIEDLMNPKDELKKRIVALAGTMKEWNEKTKEARTSVRKQLEDIIDLGLNKRKMEKTELRNLINEIFQYHGIHQSWLRKLLPKELKDTSKTRLSYQQRHEIEKERQRLLQQYPELCERSEMNECPLPMVESTTYQLSNRQELQSVTDGMVDVGGAEGMGGGRPEISGEMEPLADITTTDKDVRIVIEMPGLSKNKIKVHAFEDKVEVKSDDPQRKYHKIVELPPEANIETARCNYNNGILEITFNKKEEEKTKGKTIKID